MSMTTHPVSLCSAGFHAWSQHEEPVNVGGQGLEVALRYQVCSACGAESDERRVGLVQILARWAREQTTL